MLETASNNFSGSAPVRFSKVLSDVRTTESGLPSDVVLHRDEELIVCPTLGSFLPYWYLIIPTQHYLNFADWEKDFGERSVWDRIQTLTRSVLGEFESFIWFEHGSASRGSPTGCGVDHAHIHVILDTRFGTHDILQASAAYGVKDWKQVDCDRVFHKHRRGDEYLAFGDSKTGFLNTLSGPVGSQFFRRALAYLDGNRTDWDYREFPHHQFAQRSVDRVFNNNVSG